ncbi:hypothetical protein N7449_001838 [Penicillium cf. viridicatum]|uniref:mRNA stability protein n=1 Tax=Penicillium cf. viridicatum TaxID=2972119 RepID=A0A9W9T9X6_9EURO|nr:hypothetical protein N7449_001838 [Penicillium cf. viridicatum]
MQSGSKGPDPEPLSESDKRNERTYFDSGDFALSAADRMTDNGVIKTGRAHPHRDSISHPYAPIPAASNVDKDATEDLYRKSVDPEKSPLLQKGNIEDEEPTNEEEHDNPISHEGRNQIGTLKLK